MIWNEWHQTSGPRFPSEKFVQFLYRSYGREENSTSASALDLGCGNGIHAEVLVRLGMSVTGVDVSQAAMKQCKERFEAAGLPTPLLIRSLFSNLEFHSKSFDLVISTGVLDFLLASPTGCGPEVRHFYSSPPMGIFDKTPSNTLTFTATHGRKSTKCFVLEMSSKSG